ncbi:MAG TPA: hypothetical protein VMF05_11015 [Stellaceae bacterium]|nr:hypothetical protein [Stellaceae bacterium]
MLARRRPALRGPRLFAGAVGRRAEARNDRRLPSARRFRSRAPLPFLLALLLLAPALAGCGKKNAPMPPPGGTNTYPRSYPHE